MNSIELKDINNPSKEQALALPPHGPLDLIGNGETKVPAVALLNFLDSICLKATFTDTLLIEAGSINANLEKFIENKETPLQFKKYFLDFVNPSLSEWFYIGEPSSRAYIHFFKNGKFLALCAIGGQITTYSNCSLATYTKEFNRVITSALTSTVLRNISGLLNRRNPKLLDEFSESKLSKRSVSEEELLSSEHFKEVDKMFSGWYKVETFQNNVKRFALIHGKSNLIIWLNITGGKLCVFKVGVKNDGANFAELKAAEKLIGEILSVEKIGQLDNPHQVSMDSESVKSLTDKEVFLSMVEKLKETILSFEDNFDNNLSDLESMECVVEDMLDEIASTKKRIILLRNFNEGRARRTSDSGIGQGGRYSRGRHSYRDHEDYRDRARDYRRDAAETRDRYREDYRDRGGRGRDTRDRDADLSRFSTRDQMRDED